MLNNQNKQVTSKLSLVTFEYVKTYCNTFGVSISSFIQYCVDSNLLVMNDDDYEFKKGLSEYIKEKYDGRRCK